MLEKYQCGKATGLQAYAALVLFFYHNEHLYPGIRECFPHMLPPRLPEQPPINTGASSNEATHGSSSSSVSGEHAAQHSAPLITPADTTEQTRPTDPQPATSTQGSASASCSGASDQPARPGTQPTPSVRHTVVPESQLAIEHTPQSTQPLRAPILLAPVSHTTPATTHAPDSPCTTVQRLTEADLARVSDLARDAWADASRDARPMLWHVRRHAYERVCARMGLPVAGMQSLLWVASERGDAWGSLSALQDADPTGRCLPPELRTPLRVWGTLSELTSTAVFYTLSEEAWHGVVHASLR